MSAVGGDAVSEDFPTAVMEHPSGLGTMPNEHPDTPTRMEHTLCLPRCCPVSHNPMPGSTVSIRYRVRERVLEVYALRRYIDSFRGGHPDGTRNMEAMIQKIAQDAATALDTAVFVHAHLQIAPNQEMRLTVTAQPGGLIHRHEQGRLQSAQ